MLSKWRRWSYQNGDGGTQLKEARARQNGWISGKTPKGLSGSGFPWVLAFWKLLFSWCKSIVVTMKVLMMLEIVVCTIPRVLFMWQRLLDLYCSCFHLCDHSQPQNIRFLFYKNMLIADPRVFSQETLHLKFVYPSSLISQRIQVFSIRVKLHLTSNMYLSLRFNGISSTPFTNFAKCTIHL